MLSDLLSHIRWAQAVIRRKYTVPFINSLWHIDGLHRLRRWGFVVHGGIDGRSHVVTFMLCSDNNRSATVGELFIQATAEWGWPSRVRADWGGENVQVKAMMEQVRGSGRGSFFAGPSTHNQRIERESLAIAPNLLKRLMSFPVGLWRDVFAWSIRPFHCLFSAMEDLGILIIENPVHMWALHLVFMPRINSALATFIVTWNNHKLSRCENKTPRQLYVRGQIDAAKRGFFLNPSPNLVLDDDHPDVIQHAGVDFTLYGADVAGAQRERRDDDPNVEVELTPVEGLTVDDAKYIKEAVDLQFTEADDFYGSQKFTASLNLALQLLRARGYDV